MNQYQQFLFKIQKMFSYIKVDKIKSVYRIQTGIEKDYSCYVLRYTSSHIIFGQNLNFNYQ